MTSWAWLIIAGLLEIGFATFLKLSEGFIFFNEPISLWRGIFLVCLVGSIIGLNLTTN